MKNNTIQPSSTLFNLVRSILCRLCVVDFEKNTRAQGIGNAIFDYKHAITLFFLSSRCFVLVTCLTSLLRPRLRRSVLPNLSIVALVSYSIGLTGCEKDFEIKTAGNKPLLVVEAYINNQMRDYNYVVLSRSLDYLSLDFQSAPVTDATVTITEGEIRNNHYIWNPATAVQLVQSNLPNVPGNFKSGVYFDKRLTSDSLHSLMGKPGKSYLLEIKEGKYEYSAITTMLQPVPIDSISSGFGYIDEDDGNRRKVRVTNHYQDPDTLNNTQLYYYRYTENRNRFGWGGITRNRLPGTDELTNGEYIHLTHSRGFIPGDTIHYYMASVTRDVYNFWQSFNNARNNNGPFATPVTLVSNIVGPNVTGCFSGLSLSTKSIVMR